MTITHIMKLSLFFGFMIHLLQVSCIYAEDDLYVFDVDSYTKKVWEWKGELELTAAQRTFRPDSVFYQAKFKGNAPKNAQDCGLQLSLESRWDWEWSRLYLVGEASGEASTRKDGDTETTSLMEGYWELAIFQPDSLQVGKRLLRWGRGYAYNPVAFLERPKSSEDPEARREGIWLSQWTWIFGENVVFKTSSLALLYVPVRSFFNEDFLVKNPDSEYDPERDDDDLSGIKAYGLVGTTDLDLYVVAYTNHTDVLWGFDFASNLSANLEIHGEYAVTEWENQDKAFQCLLGLRYLTESDVTYILEWYYQSEGLTKDESETLYQSGIPSETIQAFQERREINHNYAFLQASFKEPFDWLYVTLSFTWIKNLDDDSNNLLAKLKYVPGGTWSFQVSWQYFEGSENTQYGENLVRDRCEAMATMAF